MSTGPELVDEVARLLGDRAPEGVQLVCNLEFLGEVYDVQGPYVMDAETAAALGEAGVIMRDRQLDERREYEDRRLEVVRPHDGMFLLGIPMRAIGEGPRLALEEPPTRSELLPDMEDAS